MDSMLGKILILLVMVALVAGMFWAIAQLQGPTRRYKDMTSEEFEREVQKGASPTAQVIREIHGVIQPNRKLEYLQQLDKKVEGEHSERGDGKKPQA